MVEKQDKELQLLKATFKDDDELLKSIRGLFLGFEVSDSQKKKIKELFANEDLLNAVAKKLYPKLTNETDIGIIPDFWAGIDTQIIGQSAETIKQIVESKQLVFEMLEQAMGLLKNPDEFKMVLEYNPKLVLNDPYQIGLLARTIYIKAVNTGTSYIKVLANAKEETQEEVIARMRKDSSK